MAVAAIPAVVAALFVAVMAALVIWTFAPVFRSFLQAMGQLPVIGAAVFGRAVAISDAAIGNLAGWAQSGLSPLTDLVTAVTWRAYLWRQGAAGAIHSSAGALWRLKYQALPALQARLVAYANQLYGQAIAYANQLYLQAIAYANQLYRQAIAYATQLYNQAIAWANQLYAQAIAYAGQLYRQAIAYAQAVLAQAVGYAGQLYGQSIAYAQAVLAQALGFAEDAFGRSIDYERQLYGQAVDFAERVGVRAEGYARALAEQSNAYAAAAAAAVLARVITLERSPCQKFCNPLGDLGSLLQAVEDAGLAALLLALAAEMAHDPRGTAKAIDGLIGSEVRGVTSELGSDAGFGRAA